MHLEIFQSHFSNSSSSLCFSLLLQSPSILPLRTPRRSGTMSDKISAENLLTNLMDTFTEKRKPVSFFEGESSNSVNSQFRRLFGRQRPVHHLLGGGKSADVLLWRDKKISASVLTSATSVWVLFEWLNYHLLTLLCFALVLVMVVQFIWSNASGYSSSLPSEVPRLVLPEDFFVYIATTAGAEVNRGLRFLQDVSCAKNLKQFLVVLWLHIHSLFCMKGMRMKLTTSCTKFLMTCRTDFEASMPACSAGSPRQSSKERSMIKIVNNDRHDGFNLNKL